MQSLLLSLRAVNKKIVPIAMIYLVVMVMFITAALFYGIGFIFVLPFFFHAKGIIYRNMFGIKLKIVATNQSDSNNNSQVFNA